MSTSSDSWMQAIASTMFGPLKFVDAPGYPNSVPPVKEWEDFLPKFKESEDENFAEHLLQFLEHMYQMNIFLEDVLMKMSMYSLEGDTCEWYHSLPPSSISSLQDFLVVFNDHCKILYLAKSLFENCCGKFDSYMQNFVTSCSNSDNERRFIDEEMEVDSITYGSFSYSSIEEEDVGHCIDDEWDNNQASDAFFLHINCSQ